MIIELKKNASKMDINKAIRELKITFIREKRIPLNIMEN